MKIAASFRTAIIECLQGNFTQNEVQSLSEKYPMGITYENSIRNDQNFLEASETFIDNVVRRGHLNTLINAIASERPALESALQLVKSFQKFYLFDNNCLKYQVGPFKKEVLAQKTTLFISRYQVAEFVNKMMNRDIINRLGITGKETGVSYVNLYLRELEAELSCFRFLYLNLKKIRDDDAEGKKSVEAVDVARLIAARLNMNNFVDNPNFKPGVFVQSFQNRLDALANESERWLFFIDQWDDSVDPNVKKLVRELAIVTHQYKQFFLVFDAYKDWEADFESNDVYDTPSLELRSFTKEEIKEYLDKLYENSELNLKVINKVTYDDSLAPTLEGGLFNPSPKSNVPAVSKELRNWFRAIKATAEQKQNAPKV